MRVIYLAVLLSNGVENEADDERRGTENPRTTPLFLAPARTGCVMSVRAFSGSFLFRIYVNHLIATKPSTRRIMNAIVSTSKYLSMKLLIRAPKK